MTSTMLHFALILLVAQSAFALPSVGVNFYNIDPNKPFKDNGQLVSSSITDGALQYIDGGDTPLYAQILIQIINDLANSGDKASQATAVLQTIVSIGELANGSPGDSCEAAAFINASASGNIGEIRSTLTSFAQRIISYMDIISQLVVNPNAVRYSAGPRGNCLGGGRSYRFEEFWDVILGNANAYQIDLLNEEYCAARRLYNAFNVRSNNLSAAITASAGPHALQLMHHAMGPVAQVFSVARSTDRSWIFDTTQITLLSSLLLWGKLWNDLSKVFSPSPTASLAARAELTQTCTGMCFL
ncbi:unnamed protein product, partial [Brenthis ino]